MRIRLLVIALILSVYGEQIYGEQKSPKPTSNQEHVQGVKEPSTPSPRIVGIGQENPSDQSNTPKNHPESYFIELLSANNLPNLLLFLAGLGGIAVGVRTLRDIRTQTRLLGQYVKATEEGVNAATQAASAAIKSAEIAANSANHSLKEMQLEQRAWVGVTAAKMTNFHPGQQVRAMVWVKNTGKTFALHTTIYQRIVSVGAPITNFPEEQPTEPGVTLLPGADLAAQVGGGPVPLPIEAFEAIKTGKMFVYMYGSIRYEDVLGGSHRTEFSVIYNPHTDFFDAYQGHNEAD